MTLLDPIGRDEARELARRELDKSIYHRDDPSWLEDIVDRVREWIRDLFQNSQPDSSGKGYGWVSLVVILLLVAAAIALGLWLMRGRFNTRSDREALLDEKESTARNHREAAERHAAAGEWAEAIRDRLRAIARDLEERVIVDARPGRTADELANEAGAALPDHAADLRAGVRVFDDVWYGDRPGTAEGYARLTRLDETLQAARPRPLDLEPSGSPV